MTQDGVGDEGRIDRATLLRRGAALAAGAGALAAVPGLRAAPRASVLSSLAATTSGPLLRPGSSAYNAARRVANARYDGARPLAVLKAKNVSDVRAAVRWSSRTGVKLVARSGGHSYAGYSTVNNGLVLDLSTMNGIAISADRKTVQVGGGAKLYDIYSALAARGLTIPAGSCPTVGIGGHAQGGGIGLAGRAFGATCDNITALTIVTADGRALNCNARENSDLFWACRGGGGGNFGVVTGFTFTTHRVSSASYFFGTFPWDRAAEVVAAWQTWAPQAPDALFSICALETGASSPVCTVFGQWMGSEAGLRSTLRGLTSRVEPSSMEVGTSSYMDLILRWAGCLNESPAACRKPPSDTFAAASTYVLKPLASAGIRGLVSAINARQSSGQGTGALLLDSYGGALNRVAPSATAFVHRDAIFSIQFGAYWTGPSSTAGVQWVRSTRNGVLPYASKFAYQNYIDPGLANYQNAWYGANLPRLRQIKGRRDPDRLFRFPQGIIA